MKSLTEVGRHEQEINFFHKNESEEEEWLVAKWSNGECAKEKKQF